MTGHWSDRVPGVFDPESIDQVRERLTHWETTECPCDTSEHLDALHDLALDDVPWLLAEVSRLTAERDAALARGWDEGAQAQAAAYGMEKDTGPNPYRGGVS